MVEKRLKPSKPILKRDPAKNKLFKNTYKKQASLILEIAHSYEKLIAEMVKVPSINRGLKVIQGTGGKISVIDLIAYQIGWGKCLIRWYETGILGKMPEMPGEGFSTWDYTGLAQHFYQIYKFDGSDEQMEKFYQVVMRIIEIVEFEERTGNLERTGVWDWCTLASGKKWTLSKWIRVNSVSPYKRGTQLIKKAC